MMNKQQILDNSILKGGIDANIISKNKSPKFYTLSYGNKLFEVDNDKILFPSLLDNNIIPIQDIQKIYCKGILNKWVIETKYKKYTSRFINSKYMMDIIKRVEDFNK